MRLPVPEAMRPEARVVLGPMLREERAARVPSS
jgi:hypothetical protein